MTTELVFYILAAVAVLSALGCIVQRNPIASAMFLVNTMFALAAIYVLLNAQFIAAIQVLVYAGAVMVLFLFVIMLLNLGRTGSDLRGKPSWVLAAVVAAALIGELYLLHEATPGGLGAFAGPPAGLATPGESFPAAAAVAGASRGSGVVGIIAEPLFRTYLVPFEITSILLLAAAVGAVVLAKRKI
jgi:NADH-quinone oxidoreductase subunit J